jgi:hypothetical protein
MRYLPTFLLALWAGPVLAQGVLVAPHAVFVDPRSRSGWVQLHNPGAEPAEVSIEAIFGYPVTDSLGVLQLRTVDQPDSTAPSAAGWLQIFPRRVVIPGQSRQMIRLLVLPPAGARDGEYWARLVIAAKAGQIPVAGSDSAAGIAVGLSLEVRTIIPLIYRKGQTATAVAMSNLRATADSDSVAVRVRLTRQGSAAFLGSVRGTLLDPSGKQVSSFAEPISVYYDIDPRFSLARRGLKPGQYQLVVEAISERDDIPPENILPTVPARATLTVRLR